jgi:hypothetical protein
MPWFRSISGGKSLQICSHFDWQERCASRCNFQDHYGKLHLQGLLLSRTAHEADCRWIQPWTWASESLPHFAIFAKCQKTFKFGISSAKYSRMNPKYWLSTPTPHPFMVASERKMEADASWLAGRDIRNDSLQSETQRFLHSLSNENIIVQT